MMNWCLEGERGRGRARGDPMGVWGVGDSLHGKT
jgi:hypothetical protein